jgi:NTP pyrophosphatase (non-canonical NTP hydrolase)
LIKYSNEEKNMELEKKLALLNENSSLKDIQVYINEMIETRGFDKETPQEVMLLLVEEIGELAKEIRKKTNMKMDVNKNKDEDIEGEIADVFIYVLSMCRALNINIFDAFKNKEIINCSRTWK